MLFQCWPTVFDAGPTLKQLWVNVPCLLGFGRLINKIKTTLVVISGIRVSPYIGPMFLLMMNRGFFDVNVRGAILYFSALPTKRQYLLTREVSRYRLLAVYSAISLCLYFQPGVSH